jgi:hypothetical protein
LLKTFSGRNASQNEFELRSFSRLLADHGVKRYLEIGARHGDTFHEIMLGLPEGSTGVAVDLPGGLWGTHKSKDALKAATRDLKLRGYNVSHLFGNSQETATKRLLVGRGPYDAILIDGDHTLEGVTRDWEIYRHMAPIIAFHDIVGTGQVEKVTQRGVEVPILWERLKQGHRHVEFIDEGSKMGIGVLFLV